MEVCDFVLQTANEPNNEKTNKIAEHSAQAHGKHDPRELANKIDGGHVGKPSRPTPDAAGHKSATRPHHTASKQIAQRVTRPKPVREHRTQPLIAMHKTAITHVPLSEKRRVKPQRARPMPETAIASGSGATSAPHHSSTFHRWMGHFLNPDKDRDNRDASYSTRQSLDFGPYMAYLHRVLERSWRPPNGGGSRVVNVAFKIHSGGNISALHLCRTCGNSSYDQAALAAVRQAAPFRPLPNGAPENVDIEYTFDFHDIR